LVFVLRELQQFSYQEIAEMTDLPIGTVKSRLNKARRSLRDMLAPYLAPA
jgi:RNA polymerase sigma-70 factor (ECF subfamily)